MAPFHEDSRDAIAVVEMTKRVRELVPSPMVIYSDVDGTLLGPGGCLFLDADHHLTLTPARAIVACHTHSLDVMFVSGRRGLQLLGDARVFGFNSWIAEMGCQLIYERGEVTVDNVGDFDTGGKNVFRAIEESGAPRLLFEKFPGRLEYHVPWSSDREFTHVMRGFIDVAEANELLRSAGFEDLKLIDNGRVHRTSLNLSLDLPEIHAYHLLPKASSKASAVRKDREIRKIPREATAAIGDAASDLELADEVGVLFLVANALYENHNIGEAAASKKNVFVTERAMGLGWAEAAGYLIGENLF